MNYLYKLEIFSTMAVFTQLADRFIVNYSLLIFSEADLK